MAQLQRLHNLMHGLPPPPESLSSMQATPMHIPCIYHAYTTHVPCMYHACACTMHVHVSCMCMLHVPCMYPAYAMHIPCIYHEHTESLSSMQASSTAAASSAASSSSAADAASHHCSACGKGIRNDLRRQLAGSNEIGGWRSHNLTLAPTLAHPSHNPEP